MTDTATTNTCTWAMCRDGEQSHATTTAPSAANPDCVCHKVDGLRLVLRHETGCPGHDKHHHPDNADCRRYCTPGGAAQTFIVITSQIVGTVDNWAYSYSSDLTRHAEREDAIECGERDLGHDDFCIGTLDGAGRLVAYGWGMDDFDREDRDDLGEIAQQLGLTAVPDAQAVAR